MLFAYSDGINDKKGVWQAARLVHGVQDALLCSVNSSQQSEPLSLIFNIQLWLQLVSDVSFCCLSLFHPAWGQPGADAHFCSRPHSSQTHHSLRSEILQKFPWGNVRIHSFSRWGCRHCIVSRCPVKSLFLKQTVILWKNDKSWSDVVSFVIEYVFLS